MKQTHKKPADYCKFHASEDWRAYAEHWDNIPGVIKDRRLKQWIGRSGLPKHKRQHLYKLLNVDPDEWVKNPDKFPKNYWGENTDSNKK